MHLNSPPMASSFLDQSLTTQLMRPAFSEHRQMTGLSTWSKLTIRQILTTTTLKFLMSFSSRVAKRGILSLETRPVWGRLTQEPSVISLLVKLSSLIRPICMFCLLLMTELWFR